MSATVEAPVGVVVAPPPAVQSRRLSLKRLLAINAYWFGGGAHWQPITIALLPIGALIVAGTNADLLIGRVNAAGNVFALLVPVAVGWLSDRTVSPWGRRRPWIAAGTAVNVVGLLMLGLAPTAAALVVGYLVIQIGFNLAGGAFNGVIPDVVPAEQRGRASGLLGVMNQLGIVIGLLLTILILSALGNNRLGMLAGYVMIAVVLSGTMLITLAAVREPAAIRPAPRPRLPVRRAAIVCVLSSVAAIGLVFILLLFETGRLFLPLVAFCVATGATAYFSGRRLPALQEFVSAFRSHEFFSAFATRYLGHRLRCAHRQPEVSRQGHGAVAHRLCAARGAWRELDGKTASLPERIGSRSHRHDKWWQPGLSARFRHSSHLVCLRHPDGRPYPRGALIT